MPQAHLEVLDELRQELRTVNFLSLFRSHEEFCQALQGNKRLQITLLRHLTPSQGLELLGADTDSEHIGFGLLHGEVSTLREALEANLASLVQLCLCLLRQPWRNLLLCAKPLPASTSRRKPARFTFRSLVRDCPIRFPACRLTDW